MKQFLSKSKFILILLALTFFAVEPLMHYGFPPTHDGENHVIRFYVFDKAFREGDLYPRWASHLNNEYGIPLFNYVYPLPNYLGVLFHAIGFNFIDSFKVSLLVATVVGVVFFYLWARLFMGSLASLTAAVFYAFAPYRFVDIYVRGSVGEVWALAWFPAFLWALTLLFQKHNYKYLILSSVFLAATISSHNILALMFMMFSVTYAIFLLLQSKNKSYILRLTSYIFLLALGLSAIFWLPALVEKEFSQGLQIYDLDPNFPELYQLLFPSWGTGFSGGYSENQMSFQIGTANLIAVAFGFFLLFKRKRKSKSQIQKSHSRSSVQDKSQIISKHKIQNIKRFVFKYLNLFGAWCLKFGASKTDKLLVFFLAWFILVFFLLLYHSRAIWHTVPLLEYFQFPWRLLSLMIILCAFIAGIVIEMIAGRKKKIIVACVFMLLATLLTIGYTKPAYYHQRDDQHYLSRSNFIHGTNSPGDVFNTKWFNKQLPRQKDRIEVTQGEAKIRMLESKTSKHTFQIQSEGKATAVANIAYFPGWTLQIDGNESALEMTKDGIMTFQLPKGTHTAELSFNDTMIRKIASAISILSLIVCLGVVVWGRRLEQKSSSHKVIRSSSLPAGKKERT